MKFEFVDWGLREYLEARQEQRRLQMLRIEGGIEDTVILVEHEPVYTLGVRLDADKNVNLTEEELEEKGIKVVKTRRGGDVTYHGPGQLVCYPIISIKDKYDLHEYLRNLEQVIINALGYLGIAGARRPKFTGVWLDKRKIAAIGVAARQWVTMHGFALNVNNDLTPFGHIVPCGLDPEKTTVTSMKKEMGVDVDMAEVKQVVIDSFKEVFKG